MAVTYNALMENVIKIFTLYLNNFFIVYKSIEYNKFMIKILGGTYGKINEILD